MTSRRVVVKTLVDRWQAGDSLQKIAQTLAAHLISNRQIRDSQLYVRDFQLELQKRFNLVAAEVVSAHQLSQELQTQIENFIRQATGAETVEIISSVNPELISGVTISLADRQYDGSLRRKISKLRAV